jgi:hypothetical protein
MRYASRCKEKNHYLDTARKYIHNEVEKLDECIRKAICIQKDQHFDCQDTGEIPDVFNLLRR